MKKGNNDLAILNFFAMFLLEFYNHMFYISGFLKTQKNKIGQPTLATRRKMKIEIACSSYQHNVHLASPVEAKMSIFQLYKSTIHSFQKPFVRCGIPWYNISNYQSSCTTTNHPGDPREAIDTDILNKIYTVLICNLISENCTWYPSVIILQLD